MMGMRPWAYWLSYYLVSFAVMAVVGTVGVIFAYFAATPGGKFLVLWGLVMLYLVRTAGEQHAGQADSSFALIV